MLERIPNDVIKVTFQQVQDGPDRRGITNIVKRSEERKVNVYADQARDNAIKRAVESGVPFVEINHNEVLE